MNGFFYIFNLKKVLYFILSLIIALGVGALSGFLTQDNVAIYSELVKPPLSPPAYVFAPVWTVLFILMGIASYRVAMRGLCKPEVKEALFYYLLQLAVNFSWSIIFFNMRLYGLAFFVCILLLILVSITISKFRCVNKIAGYLMIPYLLWLIFATYLNLGIWILN